MSTLSLVLGGSATVVAVVLVGLLFWFLRKVIKKSVTLFKEILLDILTEKSGWSLSRLSFFALFLVGIGLAIQVKDIPLNMVGLMGVLLAYIFGSKTGLVDPAAAASFPGTIINAIRGFAPMAFPAASDATTTTTTSTMTTEPEGHPDDMPVGGA